jgi:hypothetical protein
VDVKIKKGVIKGFAKVSRSSYLQGLVLKAVKQMAALSQYQMVN